ncbi:cation:dicarboxylase symporter family transporter, partial [Limnobacter humi]
VVYPLLMLANGISPRRFFAAAWPAIQLGFVSRSSIATLPVTEEVVEQRLGAGKAILSFQLLRPGALPGAELTAIAPG